MQTAAELSRLGKLAEYQILDSAPEKEFDEIVQVAAALLNTPISLVSLIDRDRQWFKARYGLGASETPREQAFCAHAIKSDDVYVVGDATKNPLFSQNPLVTGAPDIRFYAGAPLITSDNFRLGTLCVIDTAPREGISTEQETALVLLARMRVNAMESRRQILRAQHQSRMLTKVAEAMVVISQARTMAEVAKPLTEAARSLVVADVAHLEGFTPPAAFFAARNGADLPADIPWEQRAVALRARTSFAPVMGKDMGYADKGAWLGFAIGLQAGAVRAALQLWRPATSSFTEIETAMLADLARVASGAIERLKA